jgi:hypothetical protein
MKRSLSHPLLLVCLFALVTALPLIAQEKQHKVSIEEVNRFHELLHPIWHEQYPAKEWAKIRSQADELQSRKEAVMKVRLRVKAGNRAAVEEKRQKFGASVDAAVKAAKSGSDDELGKAVAEMHERFEQFAESLK